MYRFTTITGTTYTIHNSRVTREGDSWIVGAHHNDPMVNVRCRIPVAPTVGERCRIEFPTPVDGIGHWIETSNVVSIEPYCSTCDTYGDLFGCKRDLAAVAQIAPLLARLSA